MTHVNVSREIDVQGFRVPTFFYGTAWKEAETARLTSQALELGFRAIDTANQRRHYVEVEVGAAVRAFVESGKLSRPALFLQTKFTHAGGQDSRLPYDAGADVRVQVRQSFASSLEHLHTDYLDSYVLHGPSQRHGLAPSDRDAWAEMVELKQSGRVRLLGVSNVTLEQLDELSRLAGGAPAFVQNRCYASTGWDRDVRSFCRKHGAYYQAFSLLTANRDVQKHAAVTRVAHRIGATPAQVVFRFALELGMLPLTGTASASHATEDLAVYDLPPLTPEELSLLEHAFERA
jgi:diketogulonate reductase-like aldo/keto reductase